MGSAKNPTPRQRRERQVPQLSTRPHAVLGGVVAMEILLARTPEAALAITGLCVYPQGFRVSFSAVSRQAALPQEPPRLAIRYAAGRPVHSALESTSVGPLRYDLACWVWPLPPRGPVLFAGGWPAGAVADSVAAIDAQVILAAAARCVELWPR